MSTKWIQAEATWKKRKNIHNSWAHKEHKLIDFYKSFSSFQKDMQEIKIY